MQARRGRVVGNDTRGAIFIYIPFLLLLEVPLFH